MTSRVRAVLFDAVGTLIRPSPPAVSVYHQAGRRRGWRLGEPLVRERFAVAVQRQFAETSTGERRERQRWRAVVAEVFAELQETEELFEELWEHFAQPCHWTLLADAAELWQTLAARGLQVGVASNFDSRLTAICAQLPPLCAAEHVFYSTRLGFAKPDPRFFQAIEQQLRLTPQQILLIGDDPQADYAGARAAGWQAYHLQRSGHPRRWLDEVEQMLARYSSGLSR